MRGLTKTITLNGVEITIREVTVAEIRAWLKGLETEETDPMDVMLNKDVHMAAVRLVTGLTKEQMDDMLPSERRLLASKASEVNGDFFDAVKWMVGRLKLFAP